MNEVGFALGLVGGILGMTAPIWTAVLAGVRRRVRKLLRLDGDRAELYETGQLAVAHIVWALYGHEALYGDPVIAAWFRLAPVDGSEPVEATRDILLSELTVPWAADGFAAVYDPARPERFVLVTEVDDADGVPTRVVELFKRVPEARRADEPPPLVAVIARLGALDHELRAGTLTPDEHNRQTTELFDMHFP